MNILLIVEICFQVFFGLFVLMGLSWLKDAIFYKPKICTVKSGKYADFSFDFGTSSDAIQVLDLKKINMTAISQGKFELRINGTQQTQSITSDYKPLGWKYSSYNEVQSDACHEVILTKGSLVDVRFLNNSEQDIGILADLKSTFRKRYIPLGIMIPLVGILGMWLIHFIMSIIMLG